MDPADGVLVTTGATEAIAAAILALAAPDDEVLTLEPYYDSYGACIELAGARHTTVPLDYDAVAQKWHLDLDKARRAFGQRTRIVLLNSPHNPTGTVLDEHTLRGIVQLAAEFDCTIVSDEVYEHLVFDGQHVPIASSPGAFDRTLTISSAGKTFSVTGWKVGWISGPPELVTHVRSVKQFLTFSSGSPFQPAVAEALDLPEEYFATAAGALGAKSTLLGDGLRALGLPIRQAQSGYFLIADTQTWDPRGADALSRGLPEQCGVAAIPVSAFVSTEHKSHVEHLLRFAFCKRDEVLSRALERLGGANRLRGASESRS